MKETMRKLLAYTLSFLMLFSSLPTSVIAEGIASLTQDSVQTPAGDIADTVEGEESAESADGGAESAKASGVISGYTEFSEDGTTAVDVSNGRQVFADVMPIAIGSNFEMTMYVGTVEPQVTNTTFDNESKFTTGETLVVEPGVPVYYVAKIENKSSSDTIKVSNQNNVGCVITTSDGKVGATETQAKTYQNASSWKLPEGTTFTGGDGKGQKNNIPQISVAPKQILYVQSKGAVTFHVPDSASDTNIPLGVEITNTLTLTPDNGNQKKASATVVYREPEVTDIAVRKEYSTDGSIWREEDRALAAEQLDKELRYRIIVENNGLEDMKLKVQDVFKVNDAEVTGSAGVLKAFEAEDGISFDGSTLTLPARSEAVLESLYPYDLSVAAKMASASSIDIENEVKILMEDSGKTMAKDSLTLTVPVALEIAKGYTLEDVEGKELSSIMYKVNSGNNKIPVATSDNGIGTRYVRFYVRVTNARNEPIDVAITDVFNGLSGTSAAEKAAVETLVVADKSGTTFDEDENVWKIPANTEVLFKSSDRYVLPSTAASGNTIVNTASIEGSGLSSELSLVLDNTLTAKSAFGYFMAIPNADFPEIASSVIENGIYKGKKNADGSYTGIGGVFLKKGADSPNGQKYIHEKEIYAGQIDTISSSTPKMTNGDESYVFVGWYDKLWDAFYRPGSDVIKGSTSTQSLDAIWAHIEAADYMHEYDGREYRPSVGEIKLAGANTMYTFADIYAQFIDAINYYYTIEKLDENGKVIADKRYPEEGTFNDLPELDTRIDVGLYRYTVYVTIKTAKGEPTILENSAYLTITPRRLTVQVNDATHVYDGTTKWDVKNTEKKEYRVYGLVSGDSFNDSAFIAAGSDVVYYDDITGKATGNFDTAGQIGQQNGSSTKHAAVLVNSKDNNKALDGDTLNNTVTIDDDGKYSVTFEQAKSAYDSWVSRGTGAQAVNAGRNYYFEILPGTLTIKDTPWYKVAHFVSDLRTDTGDAIDGVSEYGKYEGYQWVYTEDAKELTSGLTFAAVHDAYKKSGAPKGLTFADEGIYSPTASGGSEMINPGTYTVFKYAVKGTVKNAENDINDTYLKNHTGEVQKMDVVCVFWDRVLKYDVQQEGRNITVDPSTNKGKSNNIRQSFIQYNTHYELYNLLFGKDDNITKRSIYDAWQRTNAIDPTYTNNGNNGYIFHSVVAPQVESAVVSSGVYTGTKKYEAIEISDTRVKVDNTTGGTTDSWLYLVPTIRAKYFVDGTEITGDVLGDGKLKPDSRYTIRYQTPAAPLGYSTATNAQIGEGELHPYSLNLVPVDNALSALLNLSKKKAIIGSNWKYRKNDNGYTFGDLGSDLYAYSYVLKNSGSKPVTEADGVMVVELYLYTYEVSKSASVKHANDCPTKNSAGPVHVGDMIEYTITITNNSPEEITVSVRDTLTATSGTTKPTLTYANGGAVKVDAVAVPANGQTVLKASYEVKSGDSGSVRNTVVLDEDGPEDQVTTEIESRPKLEIIKKVTKVVTPDGEVIEGDALLGYLVKAGDVVTFSVVVKNTGNLTITDIKVTDSLYVPGGDALETYLDTIEKLDPDEEVEIKLPDFDDAAFQHTVTEDDVIAGYVYNTATAKGKYIDPTVEEEEEREKDIEDTDSDCIYTQELDGALEMTKTASEPEDKDAFVAGDEITFTITITNTGNVTMKNVLVNEKADVLEGVKLLTDEDDYTVPDGADVEFLSDTVAKISELKPGETATFKATYTVTQQDMANGSLMNAVFGSGSTPTPVPTATPNPDPNVTPTPEPTPKIGTPTPSPTPDPSKPTPTPSPTPGAEVTVTPKAADPKLAIEKNAIGVAVGGNVNNLDAQKTPALSDIIVYEIVVGNAGDVDLDNVVVTDILEGVEVFSVTADYEPFSFTYGENNASVTVAHMPVGKKVTILAKYQVTQADILAKEVYNKAKAVGEGPRPDPTPNPDTGETPGPNDPTPAPLTPAPVEDDEHVDTETPNPSIKVEKDATKLVTTDDDGNPETVEGAEAVDEATAKLGDTITYTIVVTNNGNMTLTSVTLTDLLSGIVYVAGNGYTISGDKVEFNEPLKPGDSVTVTATYTVTEDDLAKGDIKGVENTATASGTYDPTPDDPDDTNNNETITDHDDEFVPTEDRNPHLTLEKVSTPDGKTYKLGETIQYTITVKNDGNVTLKGVVVTDDQLPNVTITDAQSDMDRTGRDEIVIDGEANTVTIGEMLVGEVVTIYAEHVVDENDILAGHVLNVATAEAKEPDGTDVPVDDAEEDDPVEVMTSELSIEKTIDPQGSTDGKASGFAKGETIAFTITVKNTGNVTRREIIVGEQLEGAKYVNKGADDGYEVLEGGKSAKIAVLGPNSSIELKAEYVVTQQDVINGFVHNVVVISDGGSTPSPSPSSPSTPTPTPTGMKPTPTPSATEDVTPQTPNAQLAIEKTALGAVDDDANVTEKDTYALGDRVRYAIEVTNIGNVDLKNVVVEDENTGATIVDDLKSPASYTVNEQGNAFIESLPVGKTVTVYAEYTITEADINEGNVHNVALANGEGPVPTLHPSTTPDPDTGETPSPSPIPVEEVKDTEDITPDEPGPAWTVNKTVKGMTGGSEGEGKAKVEYARVGDTLTYTITVKNTGNVTLDLTLSDELTSGADVPKGVKSTLSGTSDREETDGATPSTFNPGTGEIKGLAPGETMTITYTYTVKATDMGKKLKNVATATDDEGEKEEGKTETPVENWSVLKQVGTLDADGVWHKVGENASVKPGTTLVYYITVTNKSTHDLTNLPVSDKFEDENIDLTKLTVVASETTSGANYANGTITLLPKDGKITLQYAEYEVKVTDVGKTLKNVVTVGEDGPSSEVETPIDKYSLSKAIDQDSLVENDAADGTGAKKIAVVGTKVKYVITLVNEGNTILDGVEITDMLTVNSTKVGIDDWRDEKLQLVVTGNKTGSSVTYSYSEDGGKLILHGVAIGETVTITYVYTVPETIENASGAKETVKRISNAVVGVNGDDEKDDNTTVDVGQWTVVKDVTAVDGKTPWKKEDVKAGAKLTYTITVTNTGDVDLNGLSIEDVLNGANITNLTNASALEVTEGDATLTGGVIDGLEAGEYVKLTYTYTVRADDTFLTNVVTVSKGGHDEKDTEETVVYTDLTVQKLWKQGNNSSSNLNDILDGLLGKDTITLELYRKIASDDGYPTKPCASVTLPGKNADPWTAVFENLLLTDDEGNVYTYIVKEKGEEGGSVTVNGYTFTVTGGNVTRDAQDGSLSATVTNTLEDKKTPNKPSKEADKTAKGGVQLGSVITYTIERTSHLSTNSTLTVVDTLPKGLTFTKDISVVLKVNDVVVPTSAYSWTKTGPTASGKDGKTRVTWTIKDVPPMASVTITYTATVNSDAVSMEGSQLTNEVDITFDRDTTDDQFTHTKETVDVNKPLLSIKKTANVESVKPGDTFSYTLEVKNDGSGKATDVKVTDELPDDVDLVSLSTKQGTAWEEDGNVFWTIGDIKNGQSAKLTVTVKVKADEDGRLMNGDEYVTEILNKAHITSGVPKDSAGNELVPSDPDDLNKPWKSVDPDDPDNRYRDKVVTPVADFTIAKRVTSDPEKVYDLNDEIVYEIVVENVGGVELENIVVEDAMFAAGKAKNITVTIDNVKQTLKHDEKAKTVTIAKLAPDKRAVITYSYTVTSDDIAAKGKVENVALADAEYPTTDPQAPSRPKREKTRRRQDDAEVVKTEDINPELLVDKQSDIADGDVAVFGEPITYAITVKNSGNVPFTNLVVTDVMDGDLTITGAKSSMFDSVDITIADKTAVIARLEVGETVTITAIHIVTEADIARGFVHNHVSVEGDEITNPKDPNGKKFKPKGDADVEDETEDVNPKLTVTKVSSLAQETLARAGDTITYTIDVRNSGNVPFPNMVVTDNQLDGLNIASAQSSVGGKSDITIDNAANTVTIGTLQVGETVTITATYVVTESDVIGGRVYNRVTAVGDPIPDPKDPENPKTPQGEADVENVTEEANPGLKIEKTVTSIPARNGRYAYGETIRYQITVTNTGNLTLTSVTVTDELTGDTWAIPSLRPGASYTLTASYQVGYDDLGTSDGVPGSVTNVATVRAGTPDPDNPTLTDSSEVTVPTDPTYALVVHYIFLNSGEKAFDDYYADGMYEGEAYGIDSPELEGYQMTLLRVEGNKLARYEEYVVYYYPDTDTLAELDAMGIPLNLGEIMMNVGDCFE